MRQPGPRATPVLVGIAEVEPPERRADRERPDRRLAVERAGMATLNKDQRLSYDLETGRDGKVSAVNLETA